MKSMAWQATPTPVLDLLPSLLTTKTNRPPLEGPSQGRGIFAGAKTGYVVLRIEPRSASRPLRASSAFPTLTGSMPHAAGLQARQRAIRPPQAAIQGRPIPARGPGLPKIHPRPVGGLWTNRPTVTLGGRSLTLGGAEYPGALQTLEGQTSVFSLARLGQVPAGARRGQVMHRNCV